MIKTSIAAATFARPHGLTLLAVANDVLMISYVLFFGTLILSTVVFVAYPKTRATENRLLKAGMLPRPHSPRT